MERGLKLEPNNEHCLSLKSKFGTEFQTCYSDLRGLDPRAERYKALSTGRRAEPETCGSSPGWLDDPDRTARTVSPNVV